MGVWSDNINTSRRLQWLRKCLCPCRCSRCYVQCIINRWGFIQISTWWIKFNKCWAYQEFNLSNSIWCLLWRCLVIFFFGKKFFSIALSKILQISPMDVNWSFFFADFESFDVTKSMSMSVFALWFFKSNQNTHNKLRKW